MQIPWIWPGSVQAGFNCGFDNRHYFEIVAFSSKRETFPQCTKLFHAAKTKLEIFASSKPRHPKRKNSFVFLIPIFEKILNLKSSLLFEALFTYEVRPENWNKSSLCRFTMSPVKFKSRKIVFLVQQDVGFFAY